MFSRGRQKELEHTSELYKRSEFDRSLLLSQIEQLEKEALFARRERDEIDGYLQQLYVSLSTRVPELQRLPPKERVKRIIEDVNEKFHKLYTLVDEYDKIADTSKDEVNNLKAQIDGLQQENSQLIQERALILDRSRLLQQQVDSLQENNVSADELSKLETLVKELRDKNEALEKGMKTSQQTFSKKTSESEAQIKALKDELTRLKSNPSPQAKPSDSQSVSAHQSGEQKSDSVIVPSLEMPSHEVNSGEDTSQQVPIVSDQQDVVEAIDAGNNESFDPFEEQTPTAIPEMIEVVQSPKSVQSTPTVTAEESRRGEKRQTSAQHTQQNQKPVDNKGAKSPQNASIPRPGVASAQKRSLGSPSGFGKPSPPGTSAGIKRDNKWIREDKKAMYPDVHEAMVKNSATFKDRHWYVIHVMGACGVCTREDISAAIAKIHNVNVNTSEFSSFMGMLLNNEYVNDYTVPAGRKAHFLSYELTRQGMRLYSYLFDDPLSPSEIMRLTKDHDNMIHGYFIKETKMTLEEIGYTDVCMERAENTIRLGERNWTPDIIATSPAGRKIYVEVEHAKHKQVDFEDKLNKAMFVTKELYFIAKDGEGIEKLRSQISRWYFSEREKGTDVDQMTFYVTNLRNLANRKDWGNYYIPQQVQ